MKPNTPLPIARHDPANRQPRLAHRAKSFSRAAPLLALRLTRWQTLWLTLQLTQRLTQRQTIRQTVLPTLLPIAAAWLGLGLAGLPRAQAQTLPPAPSQVVITGNPLGGARTAQAAAVLTGDALVQRQAGTLGETLDGLPGVAASGFGPQASRPVIRGLDGDRVRLLDNGGASADASNLSFDHAVALDPLVVERIEVLRGPAALLYGGSATGGVVNAIDNRIPRNALTGLSGRLALRFGGAAAERTSAALLEGGQAGLNWHLDAAQRLSSDLHTPSFTPVRDGQAEPATRRVANSAGQSRSAALGASWADAQGYAGVAVDDVHNAYGVTVEPDVRIQLQRQRLQAAAERRGLAGPFSAWSLQASQTRYQHQELEANGAVGTTFRSLGHELRLQAQQAGMSLPGAMQWTGVTGLQIESLDFSALGDEAFVPASQTRSQALYTLQSLSLGGLTWQAGARIERVRVQSAGDAPGVAAPHFGSPSERSFAPRSLALSVQAPLAPGWTASAAVGHTQRAPAYYELLADGVHVATGAYERGDPQQALERSRHIELGLQWLQGPDTWRLAVFDTRFANFIALDATGQQRPIDDGQGGTTLLPEYRFSGVPARLTGIELEARRRLALAAWQLDAHASLDTLRGLNAATGQPLPRIAPLRVQAGLDAAKGAWRLGGTVRWAARQGRVPDTDIATPGHVTADVWASWLQRLGGADAVWTVKLTNLGDATAYNATALRTARELAPGGGRALWAGLRLAF